LEPLLFYKQCSYPLSPVSQISVSSKYVLRVYPGEHFCTSLVPLVYYSVKTIMFDGIDKKLVRGTQRYSLTHKGSTMIIERENM